MQLTKQSDFITRLSTKELVATKNVSQEINKNTMETNTRTKDINKKQLDMNKKTKDMN
jgi:hypothetical protein